MLYRRGWLRLDSGAARNLPRIVVATIVMGAAVAGGVMAGHGLFPALAGSVIGRLTLLAVLVTLGLAIYAATLDILGVAKVRHLMRGPAPPKLKPLPDAGPAWHGVATNSKRRRQWRSRNACFPACSRPAICTSAIISAPSPNSSRCRTRYDCIYCVVDLHAITVWQDPAELPRAIREVTAAFIACGIDPKKHIVFNQSQVAEHAELAWVFNCVARLGWLNRMTQFKEKAGKDRENASVGLYAYPNLMAADILVYRATPRAGRRRPEAASRAVARHRAEIQQRLSPTRSAPTASATRSSRCPSR